MSESSHDDELGRFAGQIVGVSARRATWRSHGGDIGAVEAISWRALRYQLAVRPRVISSRMAGDLHLEMGDTADFRDDSPQKHQSLAQSVIYAGKMVIASP